MTDARVAASFGPAVLLGAIAVASTIATSSASAQTVLHVMPGTFPGDRHGWSVAGAGDLNGDGHADLLVGAYHDDSPTIEKCGSVKLYSGLGGALLHVFYEDQISLLGMSVHGAGDVDADGTPDLIAGEPSVGGIEPGRVRVWSGATFAPLHTFVGDSSADRFGHSVGSAGDVNGDGHADLIVGAPWEDATGADAGMARVFSGVDGAVLHTFHGGAAEARLGWSVSGAGDVDGDGFDDVIVGSPTGGGLKGAASVFSGATGAVLRSWTGSAFLDYFGYAVSDAGDVDADGRPDLVVGAWGDDTKGSEAGAAFVFSGADGGLLHAWHGPLAGDRFGWSVSGGGDLDRDGRADLVVGALHGDGPSGADTGSASAFSGAQGGLLFVAHGDQVGAGFGRSVADAGDVDADGIPDVVVGAYVGDGTLIGSATVVSGLPLPWIQLGQGLAGAHGVPCLSAVGTLLGGSPLTLRLDGALENASSFLMVGTALLGAPFKGGVLVPDPDLVVPLPTGPQGKLVLAATWPAGVPSGVTLGLQFWIVDAAGPSDFAASNALTAETP